MNDQVYYDIFKKHFPDLKAEDVKALHEGYDHFVFVIKNSVTFRFPREKREISSIRKNLLDELAKVSPIPIPTMEIHHDNKTDIWYEINKFLPGISFQSSVAKQFSQKDMMQIASQLGKFLTSVHSFPIENARKLGIDEMNPDDFWAWMEQNQRAYPRLKHLTFPHLTDDEKTWIDKQFTDYIALIKKKPFQTKVTHSDMWTFHIIVEPTKHTLSGVIDFWGRIADPANDFKAFEHYGTDFVKEVYKNYSLPVDEDFEQRRLFYSCHDEVFELARQIEMENQEKIIEHENLLSDYIASHK